MSKDIVKYGNDFNLLPMPQLKALQMDIFMAILSLVREKKENTPFLKRFFNPELRELVIPQKTFIDLCRLQDNNMPYTDIFWLIDNTLEKLVKTVIKYQKDEKTIYNFVCFEIGAIIASDIHITFTKAFYDMVINLKYGFTTFELAEFICLSSKYTKTLYRLLKQYHTTGKFIINFHKFLEVMGIPPSYKMCDIDKQILRPAIRELAEPTLFAPDQIPFINLKYEKIKGKGRGRGGNVIAIEFTFKPQQKPNELEQAKKTIETQAKEMQQLTEQRNSAYRQISSYEHQLGTRTGYEHFIGTSFKNADGEIIKILRTPFEWGGKIEVEFKNQEKETTFKRTFDHENQLKAYISKNTIIYKAW